MPGTFERIYIPAIEFGNAMNAARDKDVNREDMARFYADCVRAMNIPGCEFIDWTALNRAIQQRWPKGLPWIKKRAWKLLEGKA